MNDIITPRGYKELQKNDVILRGDYLIFYKGDRVIRPCIYTIGDIVKQYKEIAKFYRKIDKTPKGNKLWIA